MAWTQYESLDFLTANDYNNIKENYNIIRQYLTDNGYNLENVEMPIADYSVPFAQMKSFIEQMERQIDAVNETDCASVYWRNSVEVGNVSPTVADVWRWIQIMNDMYEIVTGNKRKYLYLRCKDGYPTINDEKIIARGDNIGNS
jgi:hypothetical protein